MLEGLDTIDWKQYQHAYGEAVDVPDLLRALIQSPVDDFEETIAPLFSTIWHQGTVYTATAIAVPFLIEILLKSDTSDKGSILNLLVCCGTGHGYLEVHGRLDFYRDRRDKPEFQADVAKELEAVYRAHEAVVAGLAVYIPFLNDDTPEVRMIAAELIAICDIEADRAVEAIKARILIEKNLDTLQSRTANLVQSLGQLLTRDGLRSEKLNLSADDDLLFREWLIDELFPASGKAVASQFLLGAGSKESSKAALDFIQQIPTNYSIVLGRSIYYIIEALEVLDLKLAIDWIAQMTRHPDTTAIRFLSSSLSRLYHAYRLEAAPLFEIVKSLLDHKDYDVRTTAIMQIAGFPQFAENAKDILEERLNNDAQNREERILTQTITRLNAISNTVSRVQSLSQLLAIKKPLTLPLGELLDELEAELNKNQSHNSTIPNLIANLSVFDSAILEDERSIELLKQASSQNDQWTRLRAMRLLALAAPNETQAALIPALVEELRGRPVGLIAINTIGILAKAGIDVRAALPRLEVLAHATKRQIELGPVDGRVFEDEQLQELALDTIKLIQDH